MAENWSLDGLISELHTILADYGVFIDSLLDTCWKLRASRKKMNDIALQSLYRIQCGVHLFKTRYETIVNVFHDFVEDIAYHTSGCAGYLHYDPFKFLLQFERNRLKKELDGFRALNTDIAATEAKNPLVNIERYSEVTDKLAAYHHMPGIGIEYKKMEAAHEER